jgi:surfeit locus 1 family protein
MPAGYSFRPRVWALVLAGLGCAAFIALGNWQARRAEEKRVLGAQLEQASKSPPLEIAPAARVSELIHRQVAVRGTFLPQHTVFLDNKLRKGRVGFEVVTPLKLANSDLHVLVNRGWVEAPPVRGLAPQVRTPAGEVRVEGIALERLPQALQAGAAPSGRIRQNLDLESFAKESGLRLQPPLIEQHSLSDDGLLREWPRLDAGVEKHESYALQWYSLAALAAILAIVLSFRKN